MPSECPFCTIRDGDGREMVYEDEQVFVIFSNKQITPGHALIVSREHIDSYLDLPDETALHMMAVARRVAPVLLEQMGTDGLIFGINVGETAGRSVPHAHLHIMPRYADDGLIDWEGKPVSEQELDEMSARLRKSL